jgi:hypothetical protein
VFGPGSEFFDGLPYGEGAVVQSFPEGDTGWRARFSTRSNTFEEPFTISVYAICGTAS